MSGGRANSAKRMVPASRAASTATPRNGFLLLICRCSGPSLSSTGGKFKYLSFRGMLFAEESLFSWHSKPERFLTSFGMTATALLSIMPEVRRVRQAGSVQVAAGEGFLSAAHLAFAFHAHFQCAVGPVRGGRGGV